MRSVLFCSVRCIEEEMGNLGSTPTLTPLPSARTVPAAPAPAPAPAAAPAAVPVAAAAEGAEGGVVPVMFRWSGGGQRVHLTGTFTEWSRQGIPMVRSGQEFYQIVSLPRGVHEFKFVVDDEWRYSAELPVVQDAQGIVNNVVDTLHYERYVPTPTTDALDAAEEEDYAVEVQETPSNEPPTIPALLLKAGLVATPLVKELSCSSVLLQPYFVGERNKPLIPGHVLCMHLFQDERRDAGVVNLRYRHKISTHLVLSRTGPGADCGRGSGSSLRTLLQQPPPAAMAGAAADLSSFTD